MAVVTERIPILVTAEQKARIARAAEAAGLSMGEYLRRAAAAYDPAQDADAFDAVAEQIRLSAERANRALDAALQAVAASEQRLARLDPSHPAAASARKRRTAGA
ncbi:MAG: hypothetical protein AB1412_15275 [Pseudomonadota bacterium]